MGNNRGYIYYDEPGNWKSIIPILFILALVALFLAAQFQVLGPNVNPLCNSCDTAVTATSSAVKLLLAATPIP